MDGDATNDPGPHAGKTIRIDGEGRWTFDGHRIDHASVLDLLKASLRPDGRGGWEIRSDFETRPVEVEDTPLFVTGVLETEKGRYTLVLDDGSAEPLDPSTLRRDPRGFLARVHEGRFPARFNRITSRLQIKNISPFRLRRRYFSINSIQPSKSLRTPAAANCRAVFKYNCAALSEGRSLRQRWKFLIAWSNLLF